MDIPVTDSPPIEDVVQDLWLHDHIKPVGLVGVAAVESKTLAAVFGQSGTEYFRLKRHESGVVTLRCENGLPTDRGKLLAFTAVLRASRGLIQGRTPEKFTTKFYGERRVWATFCDANFHFLSDVLK